MELAVEFGRFFFKSFLLFLLPILSLPLKNKELTFEGRLFFALLSLSVFLGIHLFANAFVLVFSDAVSFFFSLSLVVLLTLAFSLVLNIKKERKGLSYLFSFWYATLLALFFAYDLFAYVWLLLFFVFFSKVIWAFIAKYNLEQEERTLVLSMHSADVLDRIDLLFDILKIDILDKELSRSDAFYLTLRYRTSPLNQHVLMKHLLNRSDLEQITAQ